MTRSEKVDLVDSKDRVVGVSTVQECVRGGILHRAVAVIVQRSNGSYVLQRRSKHDLWHPGMLTISCTGHVKKGETYEMAGKRELNEELGLKERLKRIKKYLLPPISEGGLTEREWVSLFVCETDSQCKFDIVELEEIIEVSEPRLRRLLRTDSLTPDAKIILNDFLGKKSKHRKLI